MTHWYYIDADRHRQGPLDGEALHTLLQTGQVDGAALAWREGMAGWTPLRDVASQLAPAPASPSSDAEPAVASVDETGWALEPMAAADTQPAPAEADWTPATYGASDAADAATTSPYAPPTAPVQARAPVVHGGEVVMAGFWKRVAAYCLDSVIVTVATMIVGGLIGGVIGGLMAVSGMGNELSLVLIQLVANLLSLAITVGYYAWFHASHSMATPGKMAVGIKVVRTDGARISLARGIGRYFATILSGLILGIGFLMAAFTARKQALHDMVCDTLVVDRWAFTDRPELQRHELGTVTIVVLAIFGVLFSLAIVLGIAVGIAALS